MLLFCNNVFDLIILKLLLPNNTSKYMLELQRFIQNFILMNMII